MLSRRALLILTILLELAIVESFTHPIPFLPFGYGPLPVCPALQLLCLVVIAFIGVHAARIRRRLAEVLVFVLIGTIVLCAVLHESLMRFRFELGRSAIEAEITDLCGGKSRFRNVTHPPGNFMAFPDWPIGTENVLQIDADPQYGYVRITTGGLLFFTTCGFEANITTAPDGALHFSNWKPWVYDK